MCANSIRQTVNEGYAAKEEITFNSTSREWHHSLSQISETKLGTLKDHFRRETIKTSSLIDIHFVIWSVGWIQGKDSLMHVKYEAAVWELIGRCHMIQNLLALIFILEIKQGFMGEFGLRCQRGPLQSCFKNGTMEKSSRDLQGWGSLSGGGHEMWGEECQLFKALDSHSGTFL